MAACTFDMQFTYVLAGWEGSAADSRVLKDALARRNRLFVPEEDYNDIFDLEDDDSDDEFGGGGDGVQLRATDDTNSDDSDGLVEEDTQVTSFRWQRALESTRAAQFRDDIATCMWNDN
ncbi:uncharacterized protein [Aristolochia californica]|uniref:uncharacterized protein n=1 Tax=Aristolochia californica TaxID=171875 RepID=UPI0035D81EE0